MQDENNDQPPQKTGWDHTHVATKVLLSFVPGVGGAIAEIFSAIIAPPLERRRDVWFESIYQRLNELEREVDGFKVENLAKDEAFISLFLSALPIAMKNHKEEKLEAIKNVVINSALPNNIDDDIEFMYLHIVDKFTTWHLKLLGFFENIAHWKEEIQKSQTKEFLSDPANNIVLFGIAFPELEGKQTVIQQIINDLISNGLIECDLQKLTPFGNLRYSGLTDFGKGFNKFISDPFDEKLSSNKRNTVNNNPDQS